MVSKIVEIVNKFLNSCLKIISFPGSAYVNLWSLSLLVLSIWVCVQTKSIPTSVSMIFSSIILAYGAHCASQNLSGKGSDNNDNTDDDSSNSK